MTRSEVTPGQLADRGLAGAVLDALWPILGGSHTDAETWNEISEAVSNALRSAEAHTAELQRDLEAAREGLRQYGEAVQSLAFKMPPPNEWTPQFVMLGQEMVRRAILEGNGL